ncbi:MAG TPA: thioredoxin domain-containing protein [Actinomycetes bacterium]|nr:thioredoxin domain-containing protein [Actinomycetes bacterium]
MSNRLAGATSPYLLQHQHNPVDWYAWGDEAFAEARRRDVPVLLSVGYAACHWCHVMAHESFEDDATAKQLNANFVSIKVDREERPDVDAIYMDAVTAMTGHGGWPMTVFMTPDGAPFFAGTYYPKQRRQGSPAFTDVLTAINEAWRERRTEVVSQASVVVERLDAMRDDVAIGQESPPGAEQVADALNTLMRQYDYARGGFGVAPKFPPSMVLEFLLRHNARTGSSDALLMAEGTMRAMANGGMYDQLGGGFARYSVDADWVVPHFEKMLYDNALLARVALHLWKSSGRPLGRRIAEETCDFLLRELRTVEGGFASALDADSEGEEGRFYVWNRKELASALGSEDGAWAADVFSVTEEGTFEAGSSTLQRLSEPDDLERFAKIKGELLATRAQRVRPARDDKIVASWNGLAIAALAETGALCDRTDLIDAARTAATLLVDLHLVDGRLRRVSRDGEVGTPDGVLEDYANVCEGLLALYAVTGESTWYQTVRTLLDVVLADFADSRGGLYDTGHHAERLVRRPQDPGDNATPSGQAAAAGALLSFAALSGEATYRDAAEALLASTAKLQVASPRFAGWWLAVTEAQIDGPREVAIVGPAGESRQLLHLAALACTAPGVVIAVDDGSTPSPVGLLTDRPSVGGSPTAYVCRHFTCQAPTSDVEKLRQALKREAE